MLATSPVLLKVENLSAGVNGEPIIKDINLEIREGETHALFGPNGSGKSTLLNTLMGLSNYKVLEGRIWFKGEDITYASVDERTKLGMGMSFQAPPQVFGVLTRDLLERILEGDGEQVKQLARQVDMEDMLDRELNVGFSGGERKRSEMLQLLAQRPQLSLLDEPESGVDVVNMHLIGDAIRELLEIDLHRKRKVSGLVITHTGVILDYVHADRGWIMLDGSMLCSGNPRDIFEQIQQVGYKECVQCQP